MKNNKTEPIPVMDYRQYRRARKLVHECCNYIAGNCIALDDGEECICVQSISYSRCFRLRFAALIRFMRAAHSGQYLARLEPGVNSAPHTAHFLAFSRWNSAVSSSLSCGNTAARNHLHNRE